MHFYDHFRELLLHNLEIKIITVCIHIPNIETSHENKMGSKYMCWDCCNINIHFLTIIKKIENGVYNDDINHYNHVLIHSCSEHFEIIKKVY